MARPWADLPNAKHIDRILADLEQRPRAWAAAWRAASNAAWAAIAALIAYDQAGSYLSLTPEQVLVLAYHGDNIAILMYPALLAISENLTQDKHYATSCA